MPYLKSILLCFLVLAVAFLARSSDASEPIKLKKLQFKVSSDEEMTLKEEQLSLNILSYDPLSMQEDCTKQPHLHTTLVPPSHPFFIPQH